MQNNDFDPGMDFSTGFDAFEESSFGFDSGFGGEPEADSYWGEAGVGAEQGIDSVASGSLKMTSAPQGLLVPSVICGLISMGLLVWLGVQSVPVTTTKFVVLSGAAWLFAGVVGLSALGLYFSGDNKRRSQGSYVVVGWKTATYWMTVILLVVATVVAAVCLAQWFGKL